MIKFESEDFKKDDVFIKFNITKYAYFMMAYVCVMIFLAFVSIFSGASSITAGLDVMILIAFGLFSIGYIVFEIGPVKVSKWCIGVIKNTFNPNKKPTT